MKAELIDHMGTDLTVVNSARVSFDKESDWDDGQLYDQDVRLINYLAKHNHFTPFTHPQITLRETVPVFVARQRFKHVVGFTYNETSRRYVDDAPDFFMPEAWRARPDASIKQGSAGVHPNSAMWNQKYEDFCGLAESLYTGMIEDGIAPEQARMLLPQSMFTSYYVTGSLAAWARAYKQRSDSHAQVEIQMLAHQWNSLIEPLFPVSWAALIK